MTRDEQRAAFMKFLKENPEKKYKYTNSKECALGSFANSLSRISKFRLVGGAHSIFICALDSSHHDEIELFDPYKKEAVVISENNNFGELYRKLIEISPDLAVNV